MPDEYFTIVAEPAFVDADGVLAVRVRLAGELDLDASGGLRDTVLGLVDERRAAKIIVDLDAVTFIDSEALGAILDGYNAAQQCGITYRTINAHGIVRRVLSVVGVLSLLDADSDRPDEPTPREGG